MARWIPLESNPEVLTKYAKDLGAQKGEWLDIFALDEESLTAIPQPVPAVMLLFPSSEQWEQYRKEQDELLLEKGQHVPEDLFYMTQVVTNACGTVGTIHALANITEEIELQDGILKDFIAESKGLSPLEIGEAMGKNQRIADTHAKTAEEGQTAAPPLDSKVVPHYAAFVHKQGYLFELDGKRAGPINHGPTTPEDLLKDAAKVCQARLQLDPSDYRFTVMALTTAL